MVLKRVLGREGRRFHAPLQWQRHVAWYQLVLHLDLADLSSRCMFRIRRMRLDAARMPGSRFSEAFPSKPRSVFTTLHPETARLIFS